MKTNAIIRIIAWSLVIVVLLGVLLVFTFGRSFFLKDIVLASSPEETAIPVRIEEITDTSRAAATDNVNVHGKPIPEDPPIAMIPSGDTVSVTRYETVNGIKWAYITAPEQGWVQAQYITDTADSSLESASSGQSISVGADQIQELEIEWVAGSIVIQAADVQNIEIKESDVSDAKYAMRKKVSGDKLTIQFCEDSIMDFNLGISINETLSKDLTILVPMNWECDSLEIDTAAADLEVSDLVIKEVDFDGASGVCEFNNCVVDQLDLDTASGDVSFTGSLDVLDCDAASASVTAVLDNVPTRINMDSMSGDLDLTLPENAGFTVSMDGMSSDFSSDFETTMQNGNYVCGDGSCRISVDGMSSDVILRKYVAAAAVPEATAAPEVIAESEAPTVP